jgi:FixJ family two-component response regulator
VQQLCIPPRPAGPACLVVEGSLPLAQCLELQQRLAGALVELPVVFIARDPDVRVAVEVMKRGAHDFLLKPLHEQELLDAVRHALDHDRAAMRQRLALEELAGREGRLTPRERAVLARIVEGKLNKQVAAELALAEGTVKVYRRRLMQKLGATSLADLVRITERLAAARTRGSDAAQRGRPAAMRSARAASSAADDSPTTERK